MTRDQLRAELQRDEGTGPKKNGRFLPYWDCCGKGLRECNCNPRFQGKLTVGFGRNIEDNGISGPEADGFLDNDIDESVRNLVSKYGVWFSDLDAARQAVLTNMCLNMGIDRLSKFKQTLAATARGDYAAAAVGMLQSLWADQVGARARRLADRMRSGQWA